MSTPHTQQPESESWRQLDATARLKFVNYVATLTTERQIQGRATYGDVFQGDPLKHLEEELVDGLFYCWEAKKERQRLLESISQLEYGIMERLPAEGGH